MPVPSRERGAAFLAAVLVLALALAALLAAALAAGRQRGERDRATERALAQAREALIAYAADRPVNAVVGPGYLPCPDIDNDGWAESTCGSLAGDVGQARRLGRLPWKTLGLADLRDGDGERLWYAVSTRYKGLLNCAASRGCVDMGPPSAQGTITVRDASGRVVQDGTRRGAAAVVIAPGAALERADGHAQARGCAPGDCGDDGRCLAAPPGRAAPCDPRNYLDLAGAGGEDNAAFVDRSDERSGNGDGFVSGPVVLAGGRLAVNDRLVALAERDVMPAVMRRVALEAAHCLRYYASRPENAGRHPWPGPACAAPDASDGAGRRVGSLPDTPFAATRETSGATMLARWWRVDAREPERLAELPTREDACRLALPPADAGPAREAPPGTPAAEGRTAGLEENAWWSAWKPFVFYAVAPAAAPDRKPGADCATAGCIDVEDANGRRLARGKSFAVVVARSCSRAPRCLDAACRRLALAPLDPDGPPDALATFP